MDDEISIPVSLPLDDDGFLRRECPTCRREFKWHPNDESNSDTEPVDQYFCPLCGEPAGLGSWWTIAQLEYAKGSAGPHLDNLVQDSIAEMFKGAKGIEFKSSGDFSFGIPTPEPLAEANDMVIVEPPCHPGEPIKVPGDSAARFFCLICGTECAS